MFSLIVPNSNSRPIGFLRMGKLAWAGLGLGLFFLVCALWFWEGGLTDPEGAAFTRQGWEDRPLIQRIFDPAKSDWGEYQGRELATFLNYLDACWYRMLVKKSLGYWLAPLSGMVSYLLGGWVLGWFVRREGGGRLLALAMMTLFWSSSTAAVTMAYYHRSSRPCLLPILLALLLFGLDRIRRPAATTAGRWRDAGVVLAISTTLGLVDRQGFAHSLMVGGLFIGYSFVFRRGGYLLGFAPIVGSVLATIYDVWLGPQIIHAVNGYWPDLKFQRFSSDELLKNPMIHLQAAEFMTWSIFHALGGWVMGSIMLGALVVGVIVTGRWKENAAEGTRRSLLLQAVFLIGITCAVTAGISLSFAAMILRMEAIHTLFSPRLYYYPTSIHAWLLFGVTVGVTTILSHHDRRTHVLTLGALVMTIGANLFSWHQDDAALKNCSWFSSVRADSRYLQDSLREGRPHPAMDLGYAKLFEKIENLAPDMRTRKEPRVYFGNGFYNGEFRAGRWLHWVNQEATLKVRPHRAGLHEITLSLYDEGRGEPNLIDLLLGEKVIGSAKIPASGGWSDVSLQVDLPKGESRIKVWCSLLNRDFPIKFPGAFTSLLYPASFGVGIPEINTLPPPIENPSDSLAKQPSQ
jgi:hypothetical protein